MSGAEPGNSWHQSKPYLKMRLAIRNPHVFANLVLETSRPWLVKMGLRVCGTSKRAVARVIFHLMGYR